MSHIQCSVYSVCVGLFVCPRIYSILRVRGRVKGRGSSWVMYALACVQMLVCMSSPLGRHL